LHSPGECKHTDTRCLDIHEDEELDEAQLAVWVNQASQLPGERCEREVASGVRGVNERQVTSPQAHEAAAKKLPATCSPAAAASWSLPPSIRWPMSVLAR
jgi:hypothetical protein